MTRIALMVLAIAVLLPAAGGCVEQTALLLEFVSPLSVPDEANQLELEVEGLSSGQMLERQLTLDAPFPHSFLLRPGDDPDEEVTVTVTARRRSDGKDELGAFVLRRVLVASFKAGMVTVVTIELAEDCVGVKCDSGVDCVAGLCAEPSKPEPVCEDHADCDDGDPCNGEEQCEEQKCTSSPQPDCSDSVACTEDDCQAGECGHRPLDELCSSGGYCDPVAGCASSACSSDAECDDGLICTGVETCHDGECRPGRAFHCEDDFACTVDYCDEAEGGCVHLPDHTVCDDGAFCNGAETCSVEQGCLPGSAPDCDDGDPCTDDICVPTDGGACQHSTRDEDGDGHGDQACDVAGDVPADDCNDGDEQISPAAAEICNGVDDDCDSTVDEGCAPGCSGTCRDAERVPEANRRLRHALNSDEHVGSCGGEGSEAVFSFALETVSDVFVTTHGSDVDTVLYVRACSCDGYEMGCNDDADGATTSALQLEALTPGTYTVFADSKERGNAVIQLDLHVSPAGSAGDGCGHPLPLPASGVVAADTCDATSSEAFTCVAGEEVAADGGEDAAPTGPAAEAETETTAATGSATTGDGDEVEAPDQVYYMVVTGDRRPVVIDTCSGCTVFDSILALRRECTDETPSSLMACDDDACASSCGSETAGLQSQISEDLRPGLYYIVVDGRSGACGEYELTVTGL